jgi:hypothetical protein
MTFSNHPLAPHGGKDAIQIHVLQNTIVHKSRFHPIQILLYLTAGASSKSSHYQRHHVFVHVFLDHVLLCLGFKNPAIVLHEHHRHNFHFDILAVNIVLRCLRHLINA